MTNLTPLFEKRLVNIRGETKSQTLLQMINIENTYRKYFDVDSSIQVIYNDNAVKTL